MDMHAQWLTAKAMSRKGMAGPAGTVIAVMIAIIVIVAVALPVVQDVVNDSSATGTTATILDLLPLFLGLAALVTVAALFA
jgi:Tfp pilus assembly major pilin PilA